MRLSSSWIRLVRCGILSLATSHLTIVCSIAQAEPPRALDTPDRLLQALDSVDANRQVVASQDISDLHIEARLPQAISERLVFVTYESEPNKDAEPHTNWDENLNTSRFGLGSSTQPRALESTFALFHSLGLSTKWSLGWDSTTGSFLLQSKKTSKSLVLPKLETHSPRF